MYVISSIAATRIESRAVKALHFLVNTSLCMALVTIDLPYFTRVNVHNGIV